MIGPRDEVGQRSETVHRANLSAIVRELHLRGPASRSELVARTGLTRSAIRGLIAELAGADLVFEERPQLSGSPGRPSPLVRPNPERAAVLAFEIDVDSIAAALIGLGGVVIERVRADRSRQHSTLDQVVEDLAQLAASLRQHHPKARLIGAGAAVVGVVRRSDGFVSMAPNLGWRDLPLGERLSCALGLGVPVSVANEADLGALGEARRGIAVGATDVLFLSGEVGVGGGIIVDGRPLTGAAGYAGEVGHMSVNPTGAECRCGSTGCWETEVGAHALLARAGHSIDEGRGGIDAVLGEATDGSPRALEAFAETGRWMGIGLAGLVNVLNPRLIVFGGIFGRTFQFLRQPTEAELARRVLPGPGSLARIVPASLGVDAPLLGAAELAFESLLTDPAAWMARPAVPGTAAAPSSVVPPRAASTAEQSGVIALP